MRQYQRLLTGIGIALAIIACVFASPALQAQDDKGADWKTETELWYVMEMGGGKAGWMSSITQRLDDRIRTVSDTKLKLGRGDTQVEVAMTFTFEETADGKPIRLETRQKMATRATTATYEFLPDKIVSVSNEAGKEMKKDLPLPPGEWLTPHAAEKFAADERKAGKTELSYKTVSPDSGVRAISVSSRRIGEETIDLDGKQVPVTIWKTKTDVVPIEATEKYDAEGTMVFQDLPMLGNVITRLSNKKAAMGDAPGVMPELLGGTFIKPDKLIENSMKSTTAKLKLTMKNGEPLTLPTAGAQRVEKGDTPGSVVLSVNINDNVEASQSEITDAAYRDASPLVDSTDALVMKHAKRAVKKIDVADGGNPTETQKAEALRAYVHKHINRKGMQTAFASASETINTREGDCSEHGVLLCAMLRAEGIPARVATGLVYADAFDGHEGIFGWHMWTQALIDGKWVDFDATLPVRYNATHVLTTTSSLTDGMSSTDMASIIPMLGNLQIEVVEVGYEKDASEPRP